MAILDGPPRPAPTDAPDGHHPDHSTLPATNHNQPCSRQAASSRRATAQAHGTWQYVKLTWLALLMRLGCVRHCAWRTTVAGRGTAGCFCAQHTAAATDVTTLPKKQFTARHNTLDLHGKCLRLAAVRKLLQPRHDDAPQLRGTRLGRAACCPHAAVLMRKTCKHDCLGDTKFTNDAAFVVKA